MIEDAIGYVHYLSTTKIGQKFGVRIGRKVVHAMAPFDEHIEVGMPIKVTYEKVDGAYVMPPDYGKTPKAVPTEGE